MGPLSRRWRRRRAGHAARSRLSGSLLHLGGLVLAMAGSLCGGYLPCLGPGPLRFQSARAPAAPLPPLDMGKAEVSASSTNQPATLSSKTPATNTSAAALPAPSPLGDALVDAPDFLAAPEEAIVSISPAPPPDTQSGTNHAVVTPQMLVHFFTVKPGASNGPGTSVVLPLDALGWNQATGSTTSTAVLTNR